MFTYNLFLFTLSHIQNLFRNTAGFSTSVSLDCVASLETHLDETESLLPPCRHVLVEVVPVILL